MNCKGKKKASGTKLRVKYLEFPHKIKLYSNKTEE